VKRPTQNTQLDAQRSSQQQDNNAGDSGYQFPVYPDRSTLLANRYVSANGVPFWYDAVSERVVTEDAGLFIQTVLRADLGNIQKLLILNIAGRKIQIVAKNLTLHDSSSLDTYPLKQWIVEDIGLPLLYFTGFDDMRRGIRRPQSDRYRMLTNSSGFESLEQQDTGIHFVVSVLERYGNLFSSGPGGGVDIPATVSFSENLRNKISHGGLIDV